MYNGLNNHRAKHPAAKMIRSKRWADETTADVTSMHRKRYSWGAARIWLLFKSIGGWNGNSYFLGVWYNKWSCSENVQMDTESWLVQRAWGNEHEWLFQGQVSWVDKTYDYWSGMEALRKVLCVWMQIKKNNTKICVLKVWIRRFTFISPAA